MQITPFTDDDDQHKRDTRPLTARFRNSAAPIGLKENETRPDTRHKMHLVCVLFTFENNTGHTEIVGKPNATSFCVLLVLIFSTDHANTV